MCNSPLTFVILLNKSNISTAAHYLYCNLNQNLKTFCSPLVNILKKLLHLMIKDRFREVISELRKDIYKDKKKQKFSTGITEVQEYIYFGT